MVRRRRIAVVEDEENILQVMSYNLQQEGYEVLSANDGERGFELIRKNAPDLVILDLMLPGIDGLEICRRVRANPALKNIPIIMVTAKDDEQDIVLGLSMGADDYLTKPFGTRELIARVKAALRRAPMRESDGTGGRVAQGPLSIDPDRHEAKLGEEALDLTPAEFQLLYRLAEQAGRVFSREDLLSAIGGEGSFVIARNVDTHIKTLRRKLGEHREMIETVRGFGYRFRDTEYEQT